MTIPIERALDVLCGIRADFADATVTPEGFMVILPYWAPEAVDPDGRPLGTANEHRAQWERVTEALGDAGWGPHHPDETALSRMARRLSEVCGRMHGGSPVTFRYIGGEE